MKIPSIFGGLRPSFCNRPSATFGLAHTLGEGPITTKGGGIGGGVGGGDEGKVKHQGPWDCCMIGLKIDAWTRQSLKV